MRDFGGFGFEDFFGEPPSKRKSGPQKGRDIQVVLKLTLEEIAAGVEKTIKVQRLVSCERCGGSGAERGTSDRACPRCKGTGEQRTVSRSLFGQFINVSQCSYCGGTGRIIEKPCLECAGDGRTKGHTQIKVKVPAGVSSGNYIPVKGAGDAGPRGGYPGDVFVVIEEIDHPVFTRHGNDIICEQAISFSQAALGDEIAVPLWAGRSILKYRRERNREKYFGYTARVFQSERLWQGGPIGTDNRFDAEQAIERRRELLKRLGEIQKIKR
jgi:molecular chaperone DnaJ